MLPYLGICCRYQIFHHSGILLVVDEHQQIQMECGGATKSFWAVRSLARVTEIARKMIPSPWEGILKIISCSVNDTLKWYLVPISKNILVPGKYNGWQKTDLDYVHTIRAQFAKNLQMGLPIPFWWKQNMLAGRFLECYILKTEP